MSIVAVDTSNELVESEPATNELSNEPGRSNTEVPGQTLNQHQIQANDRPQPGLVTALDHRATMQNRATPPVEEAMILDSRHGGLEQKLIDRKASTSREGPVSLVAARRVPLQDCTNWLPGHGEEGNSGTKTPHKGQWTRRARMQQHEGSCQELGVPEALGNNVKKRHSEEVTQEYEASMMLSTRKKVKGDRDGTVMYNSEVEETSREWSQTYK